MTTSSTFSSLHKLVAEVCRPCWKKFSWFPSMHLMVPSLTSLSRRFPWLTFRFVIVSSSCLSAHCLQSLSAGSKSFTWVLQHYLCSAHNPGITADGQHVLGQSDPLHWQLGTRCVAAVCFPSPRSIGVSSVLWRPPPDRPHSIAASVCL